MNRISKSRLLSSRQCLKRVHLEAHHPDTPGVTFIDGGTLSFTLAGPIAVWTIGGMEQPLAMLLLAAGLLLAFEATASGNGG